MTEYTNRIAFLAQVQHMEACNRAANALGRGGLNFSVPLSPNGELPATHYGGSTVETEEFLYAITLASRYTPESETLSQEDWDTVAEELLFSSIKSGSKLPSKHFDEFVANMGLKRILTEE